MEEWCREVQQDVGVDDMLRWEGELTKPEVNLTKSQLKSASSGSGEKPPEKRVITPEMHQSLLEFMEDNRGCAPPGHKHAHAAEIRKEGPVTPVVYADLARGFHQVTFS